MFWADRRGGQYDIYGQRYSADGQAVWSVGGIPICTAAYDQQFPTAVSDGAGGAIVVWQDGRLGDDGVDLYAQRVTSSGLLLWATDGVPVCTHVEGVSDPPAAFSQAACADGSGGAIVAWRDTRTDVVLGNTEIYAQRIGSSGSAQWTFNGVKVLGFGVQNAWPTRSPVIAPDGSGGAFIVWQDGRSTAASGNDLYAQRVTSSGVAAWTANGVVVCNASGDQGYHDIAALPEAEFALVWEDKRSGNYDIYAQRFSSSGVGRWGTGGRLVAGAANSQRTPRVNVDSLGGVVMAWQDSRASTVAPDVYAQRVDLAGVPQWSADGIPVCLAAGWQGRIRTCSGISGATVLTWSDNRADPSGATYYYDIYSQIIGSTGALAWPGDGMPVTVADRTQRLQQAVSDDQGGAYVIWEDDRSQSWDIYAQRVVPGNPPETVADISEAKSRPDGTRVRIPARVVTAVFSGFFYVEEPDRESGIRVVSSEAVAIGDICGVEGVLATSSERYIAATLITRQTH